MFPIPRRVALMPGILSLRGTLQKINISHLRKRKIIDSKCHFGGYVSSLKGISTLGRVLAIWLEFVRAGIADALMFLHSPERVFLPFGVHHGVTGTPKIPNHKGPKSPPGKGQQNDWTSVVVDLRMIWDWYNEF